MRASSIAVLVGLAFAALVGLLVDVSLARADAVQLEGVRSETASLGWSRLPGSESCATAIELGEAVEQILGRDVLVAAPDAELSLEGRIERTETGYRAVIGVVRRDGASEGERVYEHRGEVCSEATEAIALILALLIDPDASPAPEPTDPPLPSASEGPPPDPALPPASEGPTDSPLPPASEGAATDPPLPLAGEGRGGGEAAPFGVALDLSAMFSAFITPSAAPAGRAAVHLRFPASPLPPMAVVLAGWVAPWARAQLADPDAWADFLFAVGGAGICTVPRLAPSLELSICVLAEAGGAFVVGQRAVSPDERERVVFFVEASAALRARFWEALTGHVGVSLAVPFRTEPWLASGTAFYRPDPVGLFAFLGLGFDVGFGR